MVLGKLQVPGRPTIWMKEGPIALAVGACGGCLDISLSSIFSLFPPPLFQVLSGGAMVLGKLSVPRRPTNLDYSRARASCACSRCGRVFGHFFSCLSFLLSPLSGRRPDID